MAGVAEEDIAEMMRRCRCCLRDAPTHDMAAPGCADGSYAHMLKKCFDIDQLTYTGHDRCGICALCVARLCDASDFKRQVQRSQAALQALLERALQVKEEEAAGAGDAASAGELDEPLIYEQPAAEARDALAHHKPSVKMESPDNSGVESDGAAESEPESGGADVSGTEPDGPDVSGTEPDGPDECKAEPDRADESGAEPDEPRTEEAGAAGPEPAARAGPDDDLRSRVALLALGGSRCRVVVSRLTSCGSCGAPVARAASPAHACARDSGRAADRSVHESRRASNSHRTIKIPTGGKPRFIEVTYGESCSSANFISKETSPMVGVAGARPTYTCNLCGRRYRQKRNLEDHIMAHALRFRCDVCDEFQNKAALTKHRRTHNLFQCDECKKSFKQKAGLRRHMPIHTGDLPYSCELCCKKFATKWRCVVHKMTHTGEKPHGCGYCSARFISKTSRVQHEQNRHTGDKPHRCGVCPKAYAHKSSLTVHMRTHTGERPHSCDVCCKKFMTRTDLKLHKTTHTGEKLFSCEICGKKFARRFSLTQHLRIHTNDRPYSCEECNNRFNQLSALKSHKRKHTNDRPFGCEYCDKRFSQSGALVKHKRTHTGEKPYSCKICNTRFRLQGHLAAHTRTHTGEKPYTCDICKTDFTLKAHLQNHIRRKHAQPSNKPYFCKICRKQFADKLALKRHKRTHANKKCLKSDVDRTAHVNSNDSV